MRGSFPPDFVLCCCHAGFAARSLAARGGEKGMRVLRRGRNSGLRELEKELGIDSEQGKDVNYGVQGRKLFGRKTCAFLGSTSEVWCFPIISS